MFHRSGTVQPTEKRRMLHPEETPASTVTRLRQGTTKPMECNSFMSGALQVSAGNTSVGMVVERGAPVESGTNRKIDASTQLFMLCTEP